MKKIYKILLWVVGVVLGLLLLLSLIASPVAKHYVNKHGEELVGRKVQVEGLRVNFFTGRVVVKGFSLYEEDGTTVFAGFDTLDIGASLPKLLAHTVKLRHITLAGLKVNVQRGKKGFNFQSLIDHFASDEPKKDTTPSDWVMKFYNIRLSHAQIHYRDLVQRQHWHLPDINLRVPGFVVGGEEASQGGLHVAFAEGGNLLIDATYDAPQNSYALTASLDDFALLNLKPLLADYMKLDAIKGTFAAKLKAEGSVSEVMKVKLGGTLALKDVDLRQGDAQVAGVKKMEVQIKNIDLEEGVYSFRSLMVDGLNVRYGQWADHSTLDDVLVKAEAAAPAEEEEVAEPVEDSVEAPKKGKPFRFTLDTLAVTGCSLTYDNYTLPDEFHFPITDLSVHASNLHTEGENNARLHATLPGGGHLVLGWKGNIDHWKEHQQLFLSVKGLDMKQLSPWSVAYTGQPVEDGVFGFTTRLFLKNSQLDNRNKLDIYKARVGSRRDDVEPEMKIPLKTALYILKDKDDKILIELPVKGNIDSPEFSYMKVVWKTLGNLLVKVATSPVRALGNAFGFGGENLEFIEIEPAQRGLTSEQYHVLGELATIAKSDSLLFLTLEQRMPAAVNDTMARGYDFRNEIVRRYLIEQGVAERQLAVSTGEPVGEGEKTGYAISSEMKIE